MGVEALSGRLTFLQGFTHRPLSSSFLGLPYRILNINHKKELLRGLWAGVSTASIFSVYFVLGLGPHCFQQLQVLVFILC